MTPYYDGIRGVNNDGWLSIGDVKLKGSLYLAMITVNLPHGPDDSDVRYGEVKGSMQQHYQHSNPRLSPLFLADVHRILCEMGEQLQPAEGESLEACALAFCTIQESLQTKG